MKLVVHNITGKETSKKVDLSKNVFGIEPNDHAIYLDVKQYLAAQRTGTHKTKGRSEVKGSRRKLRKQKGSGAARVGDIKNPLFRGGGRVFGPEPRSYDFKVNKKVKFLARKSALSTKIKSNLFKVVDDLSLKSIKTKDFNQILDNLDMDNQKITMVIGEENRNLLLSSRNLNKVNLVLASSVSTLDIVNSNMLLFDKSSIEFLNTNLN